MPLGMHGVGGLQRFRALPGERPYGPHLVLACPGGVEGGRVMRAVGVFKSARTGPNRSSTPFYSFLSFSRASCDFFLIAAEA